MEKQSARKQDSGDADSDTERSTAESSTEDDATESVPAESEGAVGGARRAGRRTAARTATVGGGQSSQGAPAQQSGRGYVAYSSGTDRQALAARYEMRVDEREASKVARLEAEFGTEQVRRWATEGMPVEAMGKPRDMAAFRERQERRPDAVPTDIERRNQASKRRNAAAKRDKGPAGETGVPAVVRRVAASPGRSMDETVQREMESKMGESFEDVQIHTGPQAAAAAESLNARAFTVGNHVAFNSGEYEPETPEGEAVLAHELTHARQQTEGTVSLLPADDADRENDDNSTDAAMHVQPKLEVSSPDDPAEKEAEQVAAQVMQMDDGAGQNGGGNATATTDAGAQADASDGEPLAESISRAPDSDGGSGGTESTVRAGVQGGGKPLSGQTKSTFESRFGADFSDVRLHTGAAANEAARSINAKAYTMGSDIAFAKGQYQPQSTSGQQLLAHELTHVVQQGQADRLAQRQEGAGAVQSSGGSILVEDGVSISGDKYKITMKDSSNYEYYKFEEVGGLGGLNLNRSVVMSAMNGDDPELAVLDLSAGHGVHAQGSDEVGTLFQNLSKHVQNQGYPNDYAFGYIQNKLIGGSGTTGFHVAYEFLVWHEQQSSGGGGAPSVPSVPDDANAGEKATFPNVSTKHPANKYWFFMKIAGNDPGRAALCFGLHKAAVYNGWSYAIGVSGGAGFFGGGSGGGGIVFLPSGGVGVYGSASLDFAIGIDAGVDLDFTAIAGGIDKFTGKAVTVSVTGGPVTIGIICTVKRIRDDGKAVPGDGFGLTFSAGLGMGLEILGRSMETTTIL